VTNRKTVVDIDPLEELEPTAEQLAQARPFAEVFPELLANMKRGRGRPKAENPKTKVTVRLSADVLDALRASGPGWQTRADQMLRRGLKL
jgi:uncharacterized protein (DUF4415 family)